MRIVTYSRYTFRYTIIHYHSLRFVSENNGIYLWHNYCMKSNYYHQELATLYTYLYSPIHFSWSSWCPIKLYNTKMGSHLVWELGSNAMVSPNRLELLSSRCFMFKLISNLFVCIFLHIYLYTFIYIYKYYRYMLLLKLMGK